MTLSSIDRYHPNGVNVAFHPIWGGRWTIEPRQPDGSRYPSMGPLAAAWIQVNCGLVLDPWQVEILRRAFLYDPDTLDWVVEDVLIVGPEGIGKSAFFAAVALWLLDGPCMPPVEDPQPHERPNMPVVSAALSLTEHIHRHAKHYVERDGSPLYGRLIVENTKIFRASDEGHALHFPAGSGAYQQGGEPVPAIIEEELHVLGSPGIKATGEETVRITSSKRTKNANPKVQRWTITNPDTGDPESLLGQRWRYASKVLQGELEDPSLLAIHYHAALPVDLDDHDDVVRAIREATPSSWVDPVSIARKWFKGEQGLGWTMRFSFGCFYAGDDQVLADGLLEAAAVAEEFRGPPPPQVPCALTFDGARNRDSCALYGVTADLYGWVAEAWERPDDAPDDWRYDKMGIYWAVVQAMDVDHPTAILGVDPTFFEDFVYGFAGIDEHGNQVRLPGWVERWPDRVVVDVQQYGAQAWSSTRQAIADGEFTHDGDPRSYRHMRNAREVTKSVRGQKIEVLAKKRDDGKHPIDLLVTMTYAVRLAQTLSRDGEDDETIDDWRAALGVPADGG